MREHSNYQHGFEGGLTVRNLPILNVYTRDVHWVDSSASANGKGSFKRPFATLQAAIDHASAGDEILIKGAHAETISSATALLFNKAGISISGLERGSRRPTFTLDTANTAKIPVSAANVSIEGCLFVANFADIATVFLLTTAPEFNCSGNEFRDTTSSLNVLTVVTTTVSVNSDGLKVNGNKVRSLGTTAATTMVKVANTLDRIEINDNFFVGAVLNNTAALLAHGALVVTNLEMARNKVYRPNTDTATGGILITTSSTTNSGMVYDNKVKCLDAAAIILVTAGSVYGMFDNKVSGAADTSGFVLPALDTDS